MTRNLQPRIITTCICLLLTATIVQAAEKWSRQLEESAPGVADSFDWTPLAQPAGAGGGAKDRSANGRVLTYSQTFPPNARFENLPKRPPQQQFDFPFQFHRFANAPHAQQLRQQSPPAFKQLQSQEPTSQSFFKFEMPYHGHGKLSAGAPPTVQTGYQIQHTFGGAVQPAFFNSPVFNQPPIFPPEFQPLPQKPLQQHLQQKPLHQQNYIEDTVPVKHAFRESKPLPSQQTLQSVTPQTFPVDPRPETIFELSKPTSFETQSSYQQPAPVAETPSVQPAPLANPEQQEVQLLYVPYDTLYNQQQPQAAPPQQNTAFESSKYNLNSGLPAVNPYQINQFYTQDPLEPQNPYYASSTTSRPPTTSAKPSNVFQSFVDSPQFTTAKPKPKAHQPPLAMFLLRSTSRPSQSDVVTTLREASNIAVIDAPTKQTPNIFVGPAGMPTPDGYVKFDLPYLSQLSHTRDLREVPFFVAPLSYRTPNGFNKILLPEPHVGSIVVNRAKEIAPQQNVVYNTPTQNDINQYPPSTRRPSGQRIKQPSPSKDYNIPFEVTTQRATLQPSRGNKFNYFYDQDVIQEVTSPKITKHDRPKKKRPQSVHIEQPAYTQSINNPYSQFKQIPNQVENTDYYKVLSHKPTSTSTTSTSTTSTTTTSTTPEPPTYFTYNTSPQIEFHSTSGQLYPDYNTAPKMPVEEHVPRFTTRPAPSTSGIEEYHMKQYFRQQNAFRDRPHAAHPTNPPFEQVQYTPVSLDYDREVTIPSTTHKTTTTTKQRLTYYTPTVTPATTSEEANTVPPREQINEYGQTQYENDKDLPTNHRPSYNQNEILDGTVEYEPNPYQLPSELPPLTPNLPGLVNGLQDKNKLNSVDQGAATTPLNEQEPATRPTRRPINRVRNPVISKVTSSVSYSESETSSKRPQRVRRPYGSRGSASSTTYDSDTDGTSTTTRRPAAARNPLVRNPNRVRYQPTPEERQTFRIKPRKHHNGSKKANQNEDLEYQRDVLKQNYPLLKPGSSRRATSPTAIPSSYAITTTEGSTSESQQVYTVTPSNNIDSAQNFPAGLLEPMQIAQQYNDYSKENYGPGYFPNQEDLSPTEQSIKNEVGPIYTTSSTTTSTTTSTTEEPQATTRRSPFLRRNHPRLRTTTTEAPTTTTQASEERSTLRSRTPPRKVIKVRSRTRRPLHPASSTNAPEEEVEEEQKNNYRKLSRFNKDLYETDSPRRRYKNQFHLDGQESQWSPALKSNNNFQPVDPKEARLEEQHKFENEPEIVTANPAGEPADDKKPDTYEVNVSADFGSTGAGTTTTLKSPNLKPEKSFAELLEEVMGKSREELTTELESTTRTTDATYFESQKTTAAGNRLNRRNKWKRLRTTTHNNESFETAESQNLGAQLLNSLQTGEPDKDQLRTTTPMAAAIENVSSTTSNAITTTLSPQATVDEYDMTTLKHMEMTTVPMMLSMDKQVVEDSSATTMITPEMTTEESATRRIDEDDLSHVDDLETQPSLFSEVKKQLHELFAIEDSDDQAVTAALAAVGKRRQVYTEIKRPKVPETTMAPTEEAPTTPSTTDESKKDFHNNLMKRVVYATSTSTKVSSETEICYRGRCIRSEDLPQNHKLN